MSANLSTAEVTTNDKSDVFLSVFVPCAVGGAGETIDISGPLHVLISLTTNGNNFSGYYQFQPQGLSGIGKTTGAKYSGTGVTRQSFKGSLQNGQANFTFVNNFKIIGQGPGNNYSVHESLHFSINTDGTPIVFHDNFSIDCK